jgi:hypothetical protein
VLKDFNIEDYTGVAQKPLVKPVSNVSVSKNVLEIRFYWAGKGTTRIPDRGVYGPIISAVSVVSGELCVNIFFVILLSLEILYVLAHANLQVIGTYTLFMGFPLSSPLLDVSSNQDMIFSNRIIIGILLWKTLCDDPKM